MPRPSSLWLRARDQFWMTTVNGRQVKLSQDKAEARRLFHKLMAADKPARSSGVTCRKLLDTYLDKTKDVRSAGRTHTLIHYFQRFCDALGGRRADALKPYELNDWLDGLPVSESTKAFVLAALKAGFNWGAKEGYVDASPLKGVGKRKVARRTRMPSDDEVKAILDNCRDRHRDYFTVLILTGMRPTTEAGALTAAHLDREKRRAVFAKHKTAKKTGELRGMYFPPAAWEIVSRLADEHPTGPLFRSTQGNAMGGPTAGVQLRVVCRKLGIEPFPPYTFRHYMITQAIARGVPVDVLATLVGNSPAVLRATYSQLGSDSMAGVLADAALKAVS